METTMTAVFGIYYEREKADRSVEVLTNSSFSKDKVSLLAPADLGTKDLAHDRDAIAGGSTAVVISSVAVGGGIGLAAGVGVLALAGAPLLAAPFLGALVGMGAGGAIGGVIDAVDARGPSDPEARRYEGQIPEGGILVTVHCYSATDIARARQLLEETGGQFLSSSDESSTDYRASSEAEGRP